MNPKFSIGEAVIIDCKALPEFDGTEHTITDISLVTFSDHNNTELLCYKLGFTYEWQGDKEYPYWAEWSLKKKHEGSDFSFTQLMAHMNTKIVENI